MLNDKAIESLVNLNAIKNRQLQELVDILNNTTVGSITQDIDNIYNTLGVISNQIAALGSVLNITFNPDGTLLNNGYTAHRHDYEDSTINDTADGTGTISTETKQTGGVSDV